MRTQITHVSWRLGSTNVCKVAECTWCGEFKPLNEVPENPSGLRNPCLKCREAAKKHKRHPELRVKMRKVFVVKAED